MLRLGRQGSPEALWLRLEHIWMAGKLLMASSGASAFQVLILLES